MPALAYNDTPLSTDPINQTQAPIRTNFESIRALIGVNHVDFADADNGKHKFVTFPLQVAAPVFLAGEIGLYNKVAIAPFGTFNELFIHKLTTQGTATADIPFTASILSTSNPLPTNAVGWTYLPSGIIFQWGNWVNPAPGPTSGTVTFPIAFPNVCMNVIPATSGTPNHIVVASNVTQTNFLATTSVAGNNIGTYIAIGY